MNRMLTDLVNSRKRTLIIGSIVVAAGLAFIMRDIVRSFILPPILYIIWILRIVHGTLPQIFWWGLFLFLLLIIAARSLTRRADPKLQNDIKNVERESRLEKWTRWIEQTKKVGYFRWFLAHELSILTIDVLTSQDRLTTEQVLSRLMQNKYDLPPDMLEYIQNGLDVRKSFTQGEFEKRLFVFKKSSPLDIDPETIIEFLEREIDG